MLLRMILAFGCLIPLIGSAQGDAKAATALTAVPFHHVTIDDAFWSPRLKTNREVTLEANLRQCEITGRLKNFAVAGKLQSGKHEGARYNDSDVYKVLEGAAYSLKLQRDPKLEAHIDEIIDWIAAAQQPDGYLNTYFTLVKPEMRWKDIQHGHEMYCAGHLIEAAVAYYQATGKDKLLKVAIRMADHIDSVFGPGKRQEPCGHEEIELALVKLWRQTKDERYLKLAKFFLDTRGDASRGRKLFGEYAQDHKPLREQCEVCGHAVRAMYLYTGMADVAAATGDATLMKPLDAIWHDVVDRKMYLTGGIGPSASNEGFTVPYDLPNDTAYAETCAAIGMALWNHRMFLMTGEGKYADILEREVYNGILSGVSLSGDRFFYDNPLASKGQHQRVPWFDCSCCPTNIVRFLPAMGERCYATRDNSIWTVLYMSGTAEVEVPGGRVKLVQSSSLPWLGAVKIRAEAKEPLAFDLQLRIPAWSKGPRLIGKDGARAVNANDVRNGYLRIPIKLAQDGSSYAAEVNVDLGVANQRIYADPNVKANVGRVAVMRGPLVYCAEAADNGGRVRNLVLPKDRAIHHPFVKDDKRFEDGTILGLPALWAHGEEVRRNQDGSLGTQNQLIRWIPYFAWANRKPGEMVVWLPEKAELAEFADPRGTLSNGVWYQASHCYQQDTLEGLNETREPKSSGDHDIKRMTWWPHKGEKEWLTATLGKPTTVTHVSVYWFDDTGRGGCRVPSSWTLQYKDGETWKPVTLKAGQSYVAAKDQMCHVGIEPVTATEFRIEVQLQKDFSGGVLRWRLE